MSDTRETVREITLTAAGGAAPTARLFDAPSNVPFSDITVVISSKGVSWPANDLDWEIFYSTSWASGAPFQDGSIPNLDVTQKSGTLAGAGKVYSVVYEDASILPSNLPENPSVLSKSGAGGAIIVCDLENKKASPITVYVTFISRVW